MHQLEYFLWLASQAGGHPYFLIPAAACLGAAMWLAARMRYQWGSVPRSDLLQLTAPGIIAACILLCGTIFATNRFDHPSDLPLRLIGVLFLLEFPLAAWLIYRLRGVRGVALLLILPQVWYAAWAYFVSGMSINGIWL